MQLFTVSVPSLTPWKWLWIALIRRFPGLHVFFLLSLPAQLGLSSLSRLLLPLLQGSSEVVPPSPAPTNYSTNSYHDVAAELTRAPDFCLALCSRLALGSGPAIERRAQRAWEAGLWAKATLEGRVPKPRPCPKIDLKPEVYIIVRAPGLDHPVRVSTAAEYFRIIPSFRNSDSISHSFPSLAEARVYCAAIGIAFPDQQ